MSEELNEGTLVPTDDAKLEAVVEELCAIQNDAKVELAYRVGEVVVRNFYDGDPSKLHDHHPNKDASIQKLANHEDLPFGAALLYRSIRIYILLDELGGLSARKELSATHLAMVLGLPLKDQKKLIQQASAKGWSTRDLEKRVKKKRGPTSGGRPRLPAFQKGITSLGRTLANKDEFFGDLDKVDDLEPDDADKLFRVLMEMGGEIERLKGALRAKTSAYQAGVDSDDEA